MEKPWKIKGMILAFLPKVATPMSFKLSPPPSPVKPGARKIPMIPKEARRKPKNSSFEQKEPASPKVSCMGQLVNKKKNRSKSKLAGRPKPAKETRAVQQAENEVPIMKIIKANIRQSDKVGAAADPKAIGVKKAASLSQMRKYASGRGSEMEKCDWRMWEEEEEEEGKVIIPCVQASEARKEVNLWKRRNKDPPIPLRL